MMMKLTKKLHVVGAVCLMLLPAAFAGARSGLIGDRLITTQTMTTALSCNITSMSPQLWYDPSDLSTMWQSSGLTTAVSADGDPVGAITNKGSASGMNMLQATSGQRPLYKTSGGLKWLLSDGVDDNMTAGAVSNFLSASTADIWVVFSYPTISTNSSNPDVSASVYQDGGDYMSLSARSTGPVLQANNYSGGAILATVTGSPFASATNVVARIQHTGGNLTLTVNNGTPSTISAGNMTQITNNLGLFKNYNASVFANVQLYGMVAFNAIQSAGNATCLWTLLGAKAGLTL